MNSLKRHLLICLLVPALTIDPCAAAFLPHEEIRSDCSAARFLFESEAIVSPDLFTGHPIASAKAAATNDRATPAVGMANTAGPAEPAAKGRLPFIKLFEKVLKGWSSLMGIMGPKDDPHIQAWTEKDKPKAPSLFAYENSVYVRPEYGDTILITNPRNYYLCVPNAKPAPLLFFRGRRSDGQDVMGVHCLSLVGPGRISDMMKKMDAEHMQELEWIVIRQHTIDIRAIEAALTKNLPAGTKIRDEIIKAGSKVDFRVILGRHGGLLVRFNSRAEYIQPGKAPAAKDLLWPSAAGASSVAEDVSVAASREVHHFLKSLRKALAGGKLTSSPFEWSVPDGIFHYTGHAVRVDPKERPAVSVVMELDGILQMGWQIGFETVMNGPEATILAQPQILLRPQAMGKRPEGRLSMGKNITHHLINDAFEFAFPNTPPSKKFIRGNKLISWKLLETWGSAWSLILALDKLSFPKSNELDRLTRAARRLLKLGFPIKWNKDALLVFIGFINPDGNATINISKRNRVARQLGLAA